MTSRSGVGGGVGGGLISSWGGGVVVVVGGVLFVVGRRTQSGGRPVPIRNILRGGRCSMLLLSMTLVSAAG